MTESLSSSLQDLRNQGADRLDPVRFHYMQVLFDRLQTQPEPVRQILTGKLQAALADYVERLGQTSEQELADRIVARLPKAGGTPLADLNRYIQSQVQEAADDPVGHDEVGTPDLKSVRRFGEVWAKIAAESQLAQAIDRGPENAGPLNSHMLMLRSLTLMRDLSPEYLRRFLSHAEALLWLEQINKQYSLGAAKPARRSRPGK